MSQGGGRIRELRHVLLLARVELEAFRAAAGRAGLSLPDWMRTRLQQAAKAEARKAGVSEPSFSITIDLEDPSAQ